MDAPKKEKCPYCNRLMNSVDYTAGINNLSLSRKKSTVSKIRSVLGKIHMQVAPIEQSQYYMFLNETKDIKDSILFDSLNTFLDKNHLEKGHGIHYLIKMIKNINDTINMKDAYEKKTLDRMPPIKEISND